MTEAARKPPEPMMGWCRPLTCAVQAVGRDILAQVEKESVILIMTNLQQPSSPVPPLKGLDKVHVGGG